MDYNLESTAIPQSVEDKLVHLKAALWELSHEQSNKGNFALSYTLDHLQMIAHEAGLQLGTENKQRKRKIKRLRVFKNSIDETFNSEEKEKILPDGEGGEGYVQSDDGSVSYK